MKVIFVLALLLAACASPQPIPEPGPVYVPPIFDTEAACLARGGAWNARLMLCGDTKESCERGGGRWLEQNSRFGNNYWFCNGPEEPR